METSSIGAGSTNTVRESDSFGQMKSEDFFALLITEMQNQDPFNPNDTGDMINQVSQIRSIELSGNLTKTLGQMTEQQRTLGTAELIGKYVEGEVTDDEGNVTTLSGVVTGVSFGEDGAAILELDSGQKMPATALQMITSVDNPAVTTTPSSVTTPAGTEDDKAAAQSRTANPNKTPWFTWSSSVEL